MTQSPQCLTCKVETQLRPYWGQHGWLVCEICGQAFMPLRTIDTTQRAEILPAGHPPRPASQLGSLSEDVALAANAIDAIQRERDSLMLQLELAKSFHDLVVKERDFERKRNAELELDKSRLDLLATLEHQGEIIVDGIRHPCLVWAVTAAPNFNVRSALDAIMKNASPMQ